MKKYLWPLPVYCLCLFLLSGCSYLGLENPFNNDPFTGGENVSMSTLLGIPIPDGFQRYPSHGYINTTANGHKEGLETFRGRTSATLVSVDLFNELHRQGWELRLSLRKGDRSVTLYQKNKEFAILTIHRQGALTILEIWKGTKLPDGGTLSIESGAKVEEEPEVELPGEEYGPLEERKEAPAQGNVERWGSTLEEREL